MWNQYEEIHFHLMCRDIGSNGKFWLTFNDFTCICQFVKTREYFNGYLQFW